MRSELALIALLVACKKDDPPKPPAIGRGPLPLAEKSFYRVDLGPQTPCKQHQPCELRLVLSALGDYHVNEKYPNKFVVDNDNAPAITMSGDGSFQLETTKAGTWTMRYRASKAGTYKMKGTFKLGVCTEENCEIDSPAIAFDVAVN